MSIQCPVTIIRKCPHCGECHSMVVDYDELEMGKAILSDGGLIQDAFPKWSPLKRETFKSGICASCFWEM